MLTGPQFWSVKTFGQLAFTVEVAVGVGAGVDDGNGVGVSDGDGEGVGVSDGDGDGTGVLTVGLVVGFGVRAFSD